MNEQILMMRRAKAQLANQWGEAAIASLIFLAITWFASSFVVGIILIGPIYFGYYLYMSCLIDRHQSNLNLLLKGFDRFVETLIAGLLYYCAIFIGGCLLIVPGIILGCGFAMTFYIMVDDPYISGLNALEKSWNMMKGHKWDFFVLQLRFIGWILLCVLTCGIGYIFLSPYITVTNLNYYRKLKYGVY